MIARLRARFIAWAGQPNPPAWKTIGFMITVFGGLGYVAVNAWGIGLVLVGLLIIGGLIAVLTAGRWSKSA